jgi:hypothetical protein
MNYFIGLIAWMREENEVLHSSNWMGYEDEGVHCSDWMRERMKPCTVLIGWDTRVGSITLS